MVGGAGAAWREGARAGPREVVGHRPRHGVETRAALPVEARHAREQATGVGVAGLREEVVPLRPLDESAAVEDVDLVAQPGDDAEVVGDHDQGRAGLLDELAQQGEDLGLDRHVERRGRLVGDEQPGLAGQGHGDERALTHAAGELVRVVLESTVGVGDAHLLEHVARVGRGLLAGHALVPLEHLGDLSADGDDGVEGGERVLEDHADVTAATLAHLLVGEGEQVGAVEVDRAGHLVAAGGQQAHDRERGHRLAAAGLADQADGLPGLDVEAHPVDGGEGGLPLPAEGHRQVAHGQQGSAGARAGAARRGGGRHAAHLRLLGSRASRSDSPMRVKPSATTMMHRAG